MKKSILKILSGEVRHTLTWFVNVCFSWGRWQATSSCCNQRRTLWSKSGTTPFRTSSTDWWDPQTRAPCTELYFQFTTSVLVAEMVMVSPLDQNSVKPAVCKVHALYYLLLTVIHHNLTYRASSNHYLCVFIFVVSFRNSLVSTHVFVLFNVIYAKSKPHLYNW